MESIHTAHAFLNITSSRTENLILISFIFIHQWLNSPLLGLGLFFSFAIFFTQTAVLLGQGISPLQGRYLHTDNTNTE
jgi:hypothetical protein